ncbi:MAG: DnaD domain protein [Clostridiales bacterium]|nr:DnaD domain protein [Clostridiales bacterium]
MNYVKIFYDMLEAFEPLSYEERGRLLTAMLRYARGDGEMELIGSERFLFPMMRAQLDRDKATYEDKVEKSRESARKRWERKLEEEMRSHGNACEGMRTHAVASERMQDKEKDKEEEKDQYKEEGEEKEDLTTRGRGREGAAAAAAFVKEMNVGSLSPSVRREIAHWCKKAGEELVITAIRHVAVRYGPKSWGYVERPLCEWYEAGLTTREEVLAYLARPSPKTGPRGAERPKNRALDYDQRTYAPGELDDLFITGAPEED